MSMRHFSEVSLLLLMVMATLFLFSCASKQVKPEAEEAAKPSSTAAKSLETIALSVEGMSLESSANAVQAALQKVPGVSSAQVDQMAKKAVVEVEKGKVADSQLVNAVNKVSGMHATVIKGSSKAENEKEAQKEEKPQSQTRTGRPTKKANTRR